MLLGKADEALKNVLMHVNEDKRRFEQKMKIFDIVYQVNMTFFFVYKCKTKKKELNRK